MKRAAVNVEATVVSSSIVTDFGNDVPSSVISAMASLGAFPGALGVPPCATMYITLSSEPFSFSAPTSSVKAPSSSVLPCIAALACPHPRHKVLRLIRRWGCQRPRLFP